MPEFETFSRSMLPLSRDPAVTLQRRGTISLNRAAFAALRSPAAVELLFDIDSRIIGMRSVDPRSENARFVRSSTPAPSGPFLISAMAFFRVYGIDVRASRRFPAYVIDQVLCVELEGDSVPVRRGRSA